MANTNVIVKKIVVHDGVFHADDVMCVAMAKMLNPNVEVVRTRKLDEKDVALNGTNGIYIADVGYGKYDHHQQDASVRDDGNKYAACGLLYNEWKDKLFPDKPKTQRYFEEVFIKPIEQADNGIISNSLSKAISEAVPTWRESDKSVDEAFNNCVRFCKSVIEEIAIDATRDSYYRRNLEKYVDMEHIHDKNKRYEEIANQCTNGTLSFDKSQNDTEKCFSPKYTVSMIKDALGVKYDLLSVALHTVTSPSMCAHILCDQEFEAIDRGISETITDPEYECPASGDVNVIDWATYFTSRAMENSLSVIAARDTLMQLYEQSEDKEVVVLPQYMDWTETLARPELDVKFVIYPSMSGNINLQCVPPAPDSFDQKIPLPSEWIDEKPEGCAFVHKARFLAGFDTVEHAMEAAESVLDREKTKTKQTYFVPDFEKMINQTKNQMKMEAQVAQKSVEKSVPVNTKDQGMEPVDD